MSDVWKDLCDEAIGQRNAAVERAKKAEAERDALRAALVWIAKRCPEPNWADVEPHRVHLEMAYDAGACARAALAEPVQEQGVHATHCCPIHGCKYGEYCPVVSGAVRPVYPQNNGCESCEHEKPAQEPVAPTRRPLTDEDIDALWRKTVEGFKSATTSMLMRGFARNIERKITGGNDE